MTKRELHDHLISNGQNVDYSLTKSELQEIYDRLIVSDPDKVKPEPAPAPAPPPAPAPEPEPKPGEHEPGEPETEETESEPGEPGKDSFDELAGRIKNAKVPEEKNKVKKPIVERTRKKARKGTSDPDSFRVEGYVLLLVTDTVFPFALSAINNMLDKRLRVNASDLQLNEKDFAKLEPLADQAADYMAVNLNPIAGFLLIATFMYGNNLINLRMQMDSNIPS